MELKQKYSIQLAGTVTLGPKGQVVIPAEVREKMIISPGTKLVALYLPEKESVCFVREDKVQHLVDKMGAHLEAVRSLLSEDATKGR
jgi:AbrB family looped-hinge helix DNA binding protein